MKRSSPGPSQRPSSASRAEEVPRGLLFSPDWRRRGLAEVGVGVGSDSDFPRQLCWETFSQRGDTKGFT